MQTDKLIYTHTHTEHEHTDRNIKKTNVLVSNKSTLIQASFINTDAIIKSLEATRGTSLSNHTQEFSVVQVVVTVKQNIYIF